MLKHLLEDHPDLVSQVLLNCRLLVWARLDVCQIQ